MSRRLSSLSRLCGSHSGANRGTIGPMKSKYVRVRNPARNSVFLGGSEILHNPRLNKGTAFTDAERDALGIRGLLPSRVHTLDEQCRRSLENFNRKPNDLERYIYMTSLQDRNETLFYKLVTDKIEEMLPIIYTPTVGQACVEYGHILRRSRGLFITADDRGHVAEVLANWPETDVRIIVVTDGERILGLGDLGASGMGIPVGKTSLYTACGGLDPAVCLPVTLDVGTENETLLGDELYLGLRKHRIRGADYRDFFEEFVLAVQEIYPHAVLQCEDFATENAFGLLERYRDRICMFNDDIQGTAAVSLSGLYSALRITGGAFTDQRILFLGAGEAGMGAGELIVSALQDEGLSEEDARDRCWFFDSRGLVVRSRSNLSERKRRFAHEYEEIPDFAAAVTALRPTAIIGASGQTGAFSREVIEALAGVNPRPIIFALSNPTSKSECTAEEAYTYSRGTAVFASGSPFPPVNLNGRTYVTGQSNNVYIFPGIGLGAVVSAARHITAGMFLAAARAVASQVSEEELAAGQIFPSLGRIRDVSLAVAVATAEIVYRDKLTAKTHPEDLAGVIRQSMYRPVYPSYA